MNNEESHLARLILFTCLMILELKFIMEANFTTLTAKVFGGMMIKVFVEMEYLVHNNLKYQHKAHHHHHFPHIQLFNSSLGYVHGLKDDVQPRVEDKITLFTRNIDFNSNMVKFYVFLSFCW